MGDEGKTELAVERGVAFLVESVECRKALPEEIPQESRLPWTGTRCSQPAAISKPTRSMYSSSWPSFTCKGRTTVHYEAAIAVLSDSARERGCGRGTV